MKRKRIPLSQRQLPNYTRGEEIFHMVSHIVGAAVGVIVLALCTVFSAIKGNLWLLAGGIIYGSSMIALYTMSSIYHGLKASTGKKVMQVLDHCTIYYLIAGTYTPILLGAIREVSPAVCWSILIFVWSLAIVATVLTAIDLKKYAVFSMTCYILMGWCIIFAVNTALKALGTGGFLWLLSGGIMYTIGAVLYGLAKKKRYMHALFHLFTVAGSILQFVSIFFYIVLK